MARRILYVSSTDTEALVQLLDGIDGEVGKSIYSEGGMELSYEGKTQSRGEIVTQVVEIAIHFPEAVAANVVAVWVLEKLKGFQIRNKNNSEIDSTEESIKKNILDEEDDDSEN